MNEKQEFVRLALTDGANMRSPCRRFGVSPTTAYKWPARCDARIEAAVLALREAHLVWGGRKIRAALLAQGFAAPAASTITAILRRHGLPIGDFGGGRDDWTRFEHPAPNDL